MTQKFHVDVYSHHFVVTGYDRSGKNLLVDYAMDFAEYDVVRKYNGDYSRTLKRWYVASTDNRREMRFHRHVLDTFLQYMRRHGYDQRYMDVIYHDTPEPVIVELPLLSHFKPFDYQRPMIERGVKLDECINALTMAGGLGKTAVALAITSQLGMRTAVVLRGGYVERWEEAIFGEERILDITDEDVLMVRGAKDLRQLIHMAKNEQLTEKIIIITNMTLHAFFKHYQLFPNDEEFYGCKPVDFYGIIGVGFRIIDEVHQDFHLNFRQDLYSNLKKSLSLSGSLKKSSSFINRMYDVIFPRHTRIEGFKKKPYCAVTALFYQMDSKARNKVRYLSGRNQYSHNEFEESILKDKELTRNYLEIIAKCWKTYFMDRYETGMKGIVFAGRVEMCDKIVEDFKRRYPHLKISRYTGEDEYEDLLNSDVVVTTLLSAGTAVDVKDLRTALMTTAIGSIDANIQAFWRIRELKRWPKVTPDFVYLTCGDIPQHNEYHRVKMDEFVGYALSHKVAHVGLKL